MKVIRKFFVFLVLSFLFFSCSNLSESFSSGESDRTSPVSKNVKIFTGTIKAEGAIPSEVFDLLAENSKNTKSAGPQIGEQSTLNLTIFAINQVTLETKTGNFTNSNKTKFLIELTNGKWNIYAGAKLNSTDADIPENLILKDSCYVEITDTSDSLNKEFVLKPKSDGYGKLSLEMTVPNTGNNKVLYATVDCISTNKNLWNTTDNDCIIPVCNVSGTKAIISSDKIKAGKYTVRICFYDSATLVNDMPAGKLVYATIQQVVICDSFTTSVWCKSGENDPIDDNGNFILTESLTTAFELSSIYVVGKNVSGMTEGNDLHTGTWLKPVATLNKAIQLRNNNALSNCTIYIYGTVDVGTTLVEVNKNTNIEGKNSLDNTFLPLSATVECKGQNAGLNFLVVNSAVTVNVKNVTYDGSYTDAENNPQKHQGIKNSGKMILEQVKIQNCYSNQEGGGIKNNSGAEITLKGCVIQNCSAASSGGGVYNKGIMTLQSSSSESISSVVKNCYCETSGANLSIYGGGIYNEGTLTIKENTTVMECHLKNTNSSPGSSSKAYGGGIYNYSGKTLNIDYTTISLCKVEGSKQNYGGCIYNEGILEITGSSPSTIANGTANFGKGVYQNGTMNIKGDVAISDNSDVYLVQGSTTGTVKYLTLGCSSLSSNVNISLPGTTSGGTKIVNPETGFTLTDAICKKFKSSSASYDDLTLSSDTSPFGVMAKKWYVAGSDYSNVSKAGNDTSGDGSVEKPFATINKVLTKVGTVDTIYIDGTIAHNEGIEIESDKIITIKKYAGATNAILKPNSVLSVSMITVKTGAKLVLDGVVLDGNIIETPETQLKGVGISNSGTLDLINSTIQNCKTSIISNKARGGGIDNTYTGILNLTNSIIKDCCAYYGGAIYGAGTVNIDADSVIGDISATTYADASNYSNKAVYGGAIYVSGIVNNEGVICYNYATSYGGAAYVNGTFNQNGGKLIYNSAVSRAGALFVAHSSYCYIKGGIISNNHCDGDGGGIYNSKNEVDGSLVANLFFSAGVIKDNTIGTDGKGSGIYNTGKFEVSGTAFVDPSNDIYLPSQKTILFTSAVTPKNESSVEQSKFATITLDSYTAGTQIIDTASEPISTNAGKLKLTNQSYFVASDGKIAAGEVNFSDGNIQPLNDAIASLPTSTEPYQITLTASVGVFNIPACKLVIPEGKSVKLVGDQSTTINLNSSIAVGQGSTLELGNNITLSKDIENDTSNNYGVVTVKNGGKLILDGATITRKGNYGDAVEVNNGTFIMKGGLIEVKNDSNSIDCLDLTDSSFDITGGKITGAPMDGINICRGNGTLDGVEIYNCGRGLEVQGASISIKNCKIHDNVITWNNTATNNGAGIWFYDDAQVKEFSNNEIYSNKITSTGDGGGMYIDGITVNIPNPDNNKIYDNQTYNKAEEQYKSNQIRNVNGMYGSNSSRWISENINHD